MVEDINTDHLPAEVVNEDMAIVIYSKTVNPEERLGQTGLLKALVTFVNDEGSLLVKSWKEWIEIPDLSADEKEFIVALLRHWAEDLEKSE